MLLCCNALNEKVCFTYCNYITGTYLLAAENDKSSHPRTKEVSGHMLGSFPTPFNLLYLIPLVEAVHNLKLNFRLTPCGQL